MQSEEGTAEDSDLYLLQNITRILHDRKSETFMKHCKNQLFASIFGIEKTKILQVYHCRNLL